MFIPTSQVILALWASLTATDLTVKLDSATVTGKSSSSGNSVEFLGIPYAQPPVGDLRFRLPQEIPKYSSDFDATAFGPSCPQQKFNKPGWITGELGKALDSTIFGVDFPDAEDCLTINVVKPATATSSSALPVVVFMHGGAFQVGGSSWYPGSRVVNRASELHSPVIYVSLNYRISGFGFLASKEVRDAGVGNLGLQDQRKALQWVQQYIGAFGGDPTKVTIWGESSGGMSVALHMITNDGNNENLFRAAVMQSGSVIPVGSIENAQKYYDTIVNGTNCADAEDTLDCLRTVPYTTLQEAINKVPGVMQCERLILWQSVNLPWLPRVDGVFLKEPPHYSVLKGKVANVPFIAGSTDDEGTIFSIFSANLTTTSDVVTYITEQLLPGSQSSVAQLMTEYYSPLPASGSPFDTGMRNMLGPQYKRVAAISGDIMFQAPRRLLLNFLAPRQKAWSYRKLLSSLYDVAVMNTRYCFSVTTRRKDAPFLGSYHDSDVYDVYGGGQLEDYLIHFINQLDPNGKIGQGVVSWPTYNAASPKILTFTDNILWPMLPNPDTFRIKEIEFLTNVTLFTPV
ncbi:hypothetical protein H0H92_004048 [Tricholoma furcatifolium]|nr:hypothetical protein H0H92_004048 [Tricholoma furcatifolium]